MVNRNSYLRRSVMQKALLVFRPQFSSYYESTEALNKMENHVTRFSNLFLMHINTFFYTLEVVLIKPILLKEILVSRYFWHCIYLKHYWRLLKKFWNKIILWFSLLKNFWRAYVAVLRIAVRVLKLCVSFFSQFLLFFFC